MRLISQSGAWDQAAIMMLLLLLLPLCSPPTFCLFPLVAVAGWLSLDQIEVNLAANQERVERK